MSYVRLTLIPPRSSHSSVYAAPQGTRVIFFYREGTRSFLEGTLSLTIFDRVITRSFREGTDRVRGGVVGTLHRGNLRRIGFQNAGPTAGLLQVSPLHVN